MKKLIYLPIFFCCAASANAFDISGYCKKVSDSVGGSYQIEQACRDQERENQMQLAQMKIPPRVDKYCQRVAQSVGGSYQIQFACVEQELEAKGKLK